VKHILLISCRKTKIELTQGIDVDLILAKIKGLYSSEKINDIDGVKIDFQNSWVHLRKSNTEPIIRIYTEAKTKEEAEKASKRIG
jgi:phosphomannomutase